MQYVECPSEILINNKKLFLAGGITGCRDWQSKLVELLKDTDLTLFNPRRKNFDIKNPAITQQQIAWEFKYLAAADAISFWFEPDQIQPICLFELGRWSMQPKPLFVGCHPNYPRINDVLIQMKLIRPELQVVDNLIDLSKQIIGWPVVS